MESRTEKYLKILGGVLAGLLALLLTVALVIFSLKTIFGWLEHIPYFSLIFVLFALLVPCFVFVFAYTRFILHTRFHNSKPIRLISYCFFSIVLLSWLAIAGIDLYRYFSHFYEDIGKYLSFNKWILIANVFGLFLFGMMQALSMPKEADWLEKHNQS